MARSTNFQVKLEDFLTNLLSKNYRDPAQAAWLKCEISLLKDSFIKVLERPTPSLAQYKTFLELYQFFCVIQNGHEYLTMHGSIKAQISKQLSDIWQNHILSIQSKRLLRWARASIQIGDHAGNLYALLFLGNIAYFKKEKFSEKNNQLKEQLSEQLKNSQTFIAMSDGEVATYCKSVNLKTFKALAKKQAKKQQVSGYLFESAPTTIEYLLAYCTCPKLRQRIFNEYSQYVKGLICGPAERIFTKAIANKMQYAKSSGFSSYTHYSIKDYQLSATKLSELLTFMHSQSYYAVHSLNQAITARCGEAASTIKPWDYLYQVEQVKKQVLTYHRLDSYFKYKTCFKKLLQVIEKWFSLSIAQLSTSSHGDLYRVKDIKSKKIGYWWVSSSHKKFLGSTPFQSDLAKPFAVGSSTSRFGVQFIYFDNPVASHFTINNLLYILHEMGHALHGFFASNNEDTGADLVELPSQLFELFLFDYEFMTKISSKYLPKKVYSKAIFDFKLLNEIDQDTQVARSMAIFDINSHLSAHSNRKMLKHITQHLFSKGCMYVPILDLSLLTISPTLEYIGTYNYSYSMHLAKQIKTQLTPLNIRKYYQQFGAKNTFKQVLTHATGLDAFYKETLTLVAD